MARKEYDEATKAAILAALLVGESPSELSKRYKVPAATIRSWKSRQSNGESVATVATEKKAHIGDKLVDLVETEIDSLMQISIITRDENWVKAQSAEGLAVFVGVKNDKLMRMLEVFGRSEADDDPDPTAED